MSILYIALGVVIVVVVAIIIIIIAERITQPHAPTVVWVEANIEQANGNVKYMEGHALYVHSRQGMTTIQWWNDDEMQVPTERVEKIEVGERISTEDFNA